MTDKNKVLVIGGGFAGVEAAIQTAKSGFDVTLVSNLPYAYVRPISIWIPTGGLDAEGSHFDLASLAKRHRFTFRIGRVESLDLRDPHLPMVALEDGESLTAHWLIIAVGAGKLRPKGIEHTLSICGAPDEAEIIKTRIDELVKQGAGHIAFGFGGNPKDPSAVRGGPVFELLFNAERMLRHKKVRDNFTLTFFAPMESPGKKMGKKALSLLEKMFKKRRIERRVGVPITGFSKDAVQFQQGEPLEANLIVFTPGGTGLPLFKEAGLPTSEAGFIQVDDQCRVIGQERVYAVGDAAAIEGPSWSAKQGHLAEVMGRVAAKDIMSLARTDTRSIQGYKQHISILCLMDTGDGAALVRRDAQKTKVAVMPIFGHWLKKGWGHYWKQSRMGRIPRLPGM